MNTRRLILFFIVTGFVVNAIASKVVWTVGTADNSGSDLALGPSGYKKFLAHDFGYEDRYFLIGTSVDKTGFPYILPGPDDTWGGTWGTSGWRTHDANILFGIDKLPRNGKWKLVVDLVDSDPNRSVVKVAVNETEKKFEIKGHSKDVLEGDLRNAREQILEFDLSAADLKPGGNVVTISVLEGGWIVFDQIRMEGSDGIVLISNNEYAFLRNVAPAQYEIELDGVRKQPLLVDAEHLSGNPELTVKLDGTNVFTARLDTARYLLEVPMPAVQKNKKSEYQVFVNGQLLQKGSVLRSPQKLQTFAGYVDTMIGSAHSRWMIAPGPWMPFSMVKLSPDNQNMGWQAGYQPTFETLGCFSHIHEWTMGGLGMMPTNGKLFTKVGDQFRPDEGYRSRIDKKTEEAPLGYYKVFLTDTEIQAEVTATERASLQKYTFPKDKDGRVMIDLHIQAEYDYQLADVEIRKVSDYRIEGYSHQLSPRPHVWSNDADQEYVVNFVIEFDAPIKKTGGWKNDEVLDTGSISGKNLKDAGLYVEFDTKQHPVVQARAGISLVSISNAAENLQKEITDRFGWDFEAVVDNQKDVWNDIFDRLSITTSDRMEKTRFYTNVYRAMCRNTWSDVNGEWMSPDEKVRKFTNPEHVALGCDAFWNTFWNLNQFWNLVTPEWSSKWVNSQLAMYDSNGWLAKGPAGMEYIPVMVAEHEIPLIVSTYQMGIRDYDAEKAFEAMKKMQTTPAAHVAGGFAGNRDLIPYLEYKYVPVEKGRFSNTLEYSYDDWTVGQMAKALGKYAEYETFNDRGYWWRNAINTENGYAHLRDTMGNFVPDFDPFQTGRNHHYVEGNSWQLSYFVPQDVPALIDMLGSEAFVDRLDWGFQVSEPWRYNAPNDQYWDYPVVQGNQQSMHFAFLFNWAGKPWLTQKWSRSIIDKYYGCGKANAYLGDEDQGQMSAWFVMAALGLFQTDGGCRVDPVYEIASPLYEKVVIDLGGRYNRGGTFVIEAKGASRKNKYVQSATLNGRTLNSFCFPAAELLKGGSLVLQMGDKPNKSWGVMNERSCSEENKALTDYVDPNIGTAHCRWFFYTPAAVPFGMAKPAPSTDAHLGNSGGWQAVGYDFRHTSIEGFANFHEFQVGGIVFAPTVGRLQTVPGDTDDPDDGYRSRFDKVDESASPGYYSVFLKDYGVKAELTATQRVGFHRYTYPETEQANLIFDIGNKQGESGEVKEAHVRYHDDGRVEGYVITSPVYVNIYQKGADVRMYFSATLNKKPKQVGTFIKDKITPGKTEEKGPGAGLFLTFSTHEQEQVEVKVGLSYTSIENARFNRETEATGTDFARAKTKALKTWDEYLSRITVEGGKEADKVKFYTGLYHALLGRGLASDANGCYPKNDGTIGRIPLDAQGKPLHQHYNTDAIWGAFWNLTQLWSLAYPEYYSDWIKSQLLVYQDAGWLGDGIACSKYVSGVGTNFTGLAIAAAYNCGIRDFNVQQGYEAALKNELEWVGRPEGAGKMDVHRFVEDGYSPYEARFDMRTCDEGSGFGASHTMEYSFSSFAVAQLARHLGREDDYKKLSGLSEGWKKLYDPGTRLIRPKDTKGQFLQDFNPLAPWKGFQEGNAVQYTFYVPHHIDQLIDLVGQDTFNNRLDSIFLVSRKNIFGGGTEVDAFSGLQTVYNHGNQPNLHISWLFNFSGKPYLSQKWVRAILDEFYGLEGVHGYGYGQDEDQGQLGAWYVMSALGLFDVKGLTALNPKFQVGTPLFDKVTIKLNQDYYPGKNFVIETTRKSEDDCYLQRITLNDRSRNTIQLPFEEVVKGGKLKLEVGNVPNQEIRR